MYTVYFESPYGVWKRNYLYPSFLHWNKMYFEMSMWFIIAPMNCNCNEWSQFFIFFPFSSSVVQCASDLKILNIPSPAKGYFPRVTQPWNPWFRTKLRTVLIDTPIFKLFLRYSVIFIVLISGLRFIILIITWPVYWLIFRGRPLLELFCSLFCTPYLSIILCIVERGLLTICEISAKLLHWLCKLVIIFLSSIVVSARLRPIFPRWFWTVRNYNCYWCPWRFQTYWRYQSWLWNNDMMRLQYKLSCKQFGIRTVQTSIASIFLSIFCFFLISQVIQVINSSFRLHLFQRFPKIWIHSLSIRNYLINNNITKSSLKLIRILSAPSVCRIDP